MGQFDALFKPLTIKSVTIRNRVMTTAHTSGAGEDGKPKEKYQAYQEERAKGGVGLCMIGGSTAVAPDSPGADMRHLDASTDDIIPYYKQLSERIHKHGAAVFGQVSHMGRRANWDNDRWLPPVAPSRVREPAHRSFPREMEDWDIERLVKAFGEATGRIKKGGIDGVEISATHGHLIDQFWSPRSNRRTDRYGGSLKNRLRFTFEVLEAIRREVGDDYIVGLRMSSDELITGGLTSKDCISIAQELTKNGYLDYLSLLAGQAENLPSHAVIFPGMEMPSAPYLSFVGEVRANVDVPVFHAQRINDVVAAARIIEEGLVDMVGMTRPHLADPHIMRKLMEGRPEDIRPCVGANYCIDRLYSGGQAYCIHNAATGREQEIPHVHNKADKAKKIVVVGAGVAGLEAARVLAERGHKITLFEKSDKTGGQVNLASRVSWREGLSAIPRWLEGQVRKHGVDLRLKTEADVEAVIALEPEIVIIATGGVPDRGGFPGHDLSLTVWDILSGHSEPGRSVLIFDDNGSEQALSCAEFMAERGSEIEFITADPHPGQLLERTTRPIFLKHLYEQEVIFTPDCRLIEIYKERCRLIAVLLNEYTLSEEERVVDQVVIESGTVPCDDLYHRLKPHSTNKGALDLPALVEGRPQKIETNPDGGFQLFRIGDAVSSRNIHAAIYDAARLCKIM